MTIEQKSREGVFRCVRSVITVQAGSLHWFAEGDTIVHGATKGESPNHDSKMGESQKSSPIRSNSNS